MGVWVDVGVALGVGVFVGVGVKVGANAVNVNRKSALESVGIAAIVASKSAIAVALASGVSVAVGSGVSVSAGTIVSVGVISTVGVSVAVVVILWPARMSMPPLLISGANSTWLTCALMTLTPMTITATEMRNRKMKRCIVDS